MSSHLSSGRICCGLAILFIFCISGVAQGQSVTALNGVYNGTYRCAQVEVGMKMSTTVTRSKELSALFTYYLPPGTRNQAYTLRLAGQYDERTARYSLMPVKWETAPPPNPALVGFNGTLGPTTMSGTVTGNFGAVCSFRAERERSATSTNPGRQTTPAATGARPATSATATLQTFCYSDLDQPVVYVSQSFDTHLSAALSVPEQVIDLALFADDFVLFLIERYGFRLPEKESFADCFEGYGSRDARESQQRRSAWEARARAAGKKIVETTWVPAAK